MMDAVKKRVVAIETDNYGLVVRKNTIVRILPRYYGYKLLVGIFKMY